MNNLEKERLELANNLVQKHGAKAYKASFEDEGASSEDISRAMIVTERADLDLDIKIGGCEAIADIRQAKILGAKAIVGPMIESPYAMKKFISAIESVYNEEELENLELGVNIETITGAENIESILSVPKVDKMIKRIALGRSDFTNSMDLPKSEINSDKVFEHVQKVLSVAKSHNIETAMGGGIDINAIPFIKKLGSLLDYYETRYIIFKNDKNQSEKEMAAGMMKAQEFEANYLKDISIRYKDWSLTNLKRCEMITNRVKEAKKYIAGLDEKDER